MLARRYALSMKRRNSRYTPALVQGLEQLCALLILLRVLQQGPQAASLRRQTASLVVDITVLALAACLQRTRLTAYRLQ